ncbi:MAG: translation initiation factor IF-2 associated domain-containing protein, partial [Pseudomonadota bacterium]
MSDTQNPTDKTLSVSQGKKTLSLKRTVETGTVRQSFSHGRSKAVVVEKKRRRILKPGETADGGAPEAAPAPAAQSAPASSAASAPASAPNAPPASTVASTVASTPSAPVARARVAERPATPRPSSGGAARNLTTGERDARAQALADARVREQEEQERAKDLARIQAAEAERLAAEQAEAEERA